MVVLGIDPGSIRCGYGLVQIDKELLKVLSFGVIEPKKATNDFLTRLKFIYTQIEALIEDYKVDEVVVENQFYSKNAQSLIKLTQARTSAILASVNKNLPVYEYSPRQVKQAVTGNGNATKKSVSFMVSSILNLNLSGNFFDISDALAVALCHWSKTNQSAFGRTKPKSWKEYIEQNPGKVYE